MSLRSNGSYIGYNRVTTTSQDSASGIWSLAAAERRRRAAAWPMPVVGDPYFANVSLLLHMDGSNGSTTFTDSSPYARTGITSSGASISTSQSKFGGSSLAWNNNSISVPYNANLYDFGSGPFVIEFWMYPTSKPDNAFYAKSGNWGAFALYCQVNPTDDRLLFLINNGGELAIVGLGSSGSWTQYSQMPAFTLNQWYYVAISRSGDTLRAYLNGQLVSSRVNSSYSFPVTSANLTIGGGGSGYFDDFRITVGTDRGMTGSTITVPTAAFPDAVPGTDPLFSLVSLLLHMDGSGSTFTDSSGTPKTITASGNATQSTAQSKFGGKSGYFDGTGDYLTVSDEGQFDFSGDFTIECWAYSSRTSGNQGGLFSKRSYGTFGGVLLNHYPDGRLQMLATANNSSWSVNAETATGTFPLNAWAHVAVVRSGSTMTLYVDGVSKATGTINGAIANNSEPFVIAGGGSNGADAFTGYIDEFRVTNSARYLSGFTPPTAAFPGA